MNEIEAFPKPIYITRPLLPDTKELKKLVDEIWESNQLTNNGRMAQKLEKELAEYLNVKHLSLFSNGTVALLLACKVLRLSGEVITTPFTFAATTHALSWSNIKPVFCDVEEGTFNIDPDRIEKLITPGTTGILPVHVFGNPCDVKKIDAIAKKYGLKVLYDAAHAFGVKVQGEPIGSFGDISMFSLHATKIYHTLEGGALTFNNPNYKEQADILKNFGIRSDENIMEPGLNGKLNEVQAAVGILVLKLVDEEIKRRKEVTKLYRQQLLNIEGIHFFEDIAGVTHNYPYFVIQVDKEKFGATRDELYERLKGYNIFSRKYFYPLCSQFQCYQDLPSAASRNLPVATEVTKKVLALPLHGRMQGEDIEKICRIIKHIGETTSTTC